MIVSKRGAIYKSKTEDEYFMIINISRGKVEYVKVTVRMIDGDDENLSIEKEGDSTKVMVKTFLKRFDLVY